MKTKLKLISGILAAAMLCGIFAGCKSEKKTINIYSEADDYRNVHIREMLDEKFGDEYNIVVTDIDSGTFTAKLAAEGKDTDIDIILEMESTYLKKFDDSLAALDDFDFSPFLDDLVPANKKYVPWLKFSGAVILNKQVLADKGVDAPKSYDDLLKPEYKGLISMPSPKSSGTGYIFLLNMVNERGEDAAFEYFDKLSENISGQGFTTSGSGPVKALIQGEAGIALGLTYNAAQEIDKGMDFEITFFEEGAPFTNYAAAVIAGKEKDADIMKVFKYVANEVNLEDKRLYSPEQIFKTQETTLKSFPEVPYGNMTGIDDIELKERLLDKWTH